MSGAPLILGLWSVTLEPGKTISQNTSPAIQITNVCYGPEVKGNARSAVMMKYPEFEQDSDDEDDEEEEEDEDDEEGNIKLPNLITKETVLAVLKPNGSEQAAINVCLVEDVEVVELSVSGENPVYLTGHYIRQEDFDQEPYSDSEDGSEFDEEFDDSDISGLIGEGSEDEDMEDRIQELKEEKPSKKRSAEASSAADDSTVSAADLAGLSKNQKKKLLKAQNGEAVPAPAAAASPAAAKKEEKKVEKKAPAATGPKVQTLAGGLEITDAKVGTGAAAKAGSKVGMRYIGKLENGKVFDSNTKGSPLSFTLGRGQVITGWDKGIVGMQVGGERKLRIPAAMAYGKKGTQGIPGNSVLLFDVKLVSLKNACTAGCGAFWLWLCINGKEDLVCTGYPFMASACKLSGMRYLFWTIYIISFIAQILVFFIVKLGDIPCLNFGGRGKSRSMGKISRRRGRGGEDEEGEAMGLQRAWNSDSSRQESDSDEHKQRTMSGKGRGDGNESAGRKSLGLSDEEMSGEGGSGRRSSMGRY
ncbi:hypothetical protein JCM5353_005236 [Sporobolomyces roseus]